MAYAPQSPLDEEEQQQPTMSQGQPLVSSQAPSPQAAPSTAMRAPVPQQNANRSGRWTNLQTILGQNTGIAKQIGTAGDSELKGAQEKFDAKANPLRSASFQANTNWRPAIEQARSATTMPTSHSGLGVMRSHESTPYSTLRSMLTQQYSGPGQMSFDSDAETKRLNSLANARTAGAEMASGPYSASASRLDAAMMQGSGDVRAVQDSLGRNAASFRDASEKEEAALNDKVGKFGERAASAREEVRRGLSGYGQEMLRALQASADEANARARADFDNGVVRDQSGRVVQFAPPPGTHAEDIISDKNYYAPAGKMRGEWVGAAPGSASIGNMASQGDVAAFRLLRELIGDPSFAVESTGAYTPGGYSIVDDPNYTPPAPKTPGPMQKRELNEDGSVRQDPSEAEYAKWAAENPEAAAEEEKRKADERARKLARRNDI